MIVGQDANLRALPPEVTLDSGLAGPPGAGFAENTFRGILAGALDSGYRFARLDRCAPAAGPAAEAEPVFYLRHDVDISPRMAARLGEIEHEYGITGNFFFQINAETYSFFVPETLGIIHRLRGMGHCVGLHVDELLIGADERAIERTFDWVSDHVVPVDRVISFHRPSPAVLGRRYASVMNAYDDRVFDAASYLSDSRRSIDFHGTLMGWLTQRRPRIQLLLHPEWWCEIPSIGQFWNQLTGRRTDQLRHYMLDNFPKVFSGVLSREDRSFKI